MCCSIPKGICYITRKLDAPIKEVIQYQVAELILLANQHLLYAAQSAGAVENAAEG